ncbi:hypothetical protein F0562_029305 [Nyssa sinensis]|uniref:Acetylajmalan esterase-like n=1 Tax=Nyssa sinensis TaxID=561372 RepID=A0A5J5B4T1_9ASTE|nr:hypothetical protein F0562_029305 [Nyssa sinensis]
MASNQKLLSVLLLIITVSLLFSQPCQSHLLKMCNFAQIYQLGDSISDTGNLIRESFIGAASPFSRLPFGETFFNNATGRCSNGLLMIDFFALEAGLPFLNSYKNIDANFKHGVNFAVAGSTALSAHVLAKKGISCPVTNSSLHLQLEWMHTYFNSICYNHRDCIEKLKNSLFMVGEIGGNDYNYALFQGNFSIGCLPIYLTGFKTNDSTTYDEYHCLKGLNELSMYHNDHVQKVIKDLKKEYPNTIIVYGDYYNAFQWLFHNAPRLGFDAVFTKSMLWNWR